MIDRKLKIGDYVFNTDGQLARVISINKCSYGIKVLGDNNWYYGRATIKFDGTPRWSYEYGNQEWFYCDDVQAKALEIANKRLSKYKDFEEVAERVEKLFGKAKFFLEQIKEIETEEVHICGDDELF